MPHAKREKKKNHHLEDLQRLDRSANVGESLLESPCLLLPLRCTPPRYALDTLKEPNSIGLEREGETLLASLRRLARLGSFFKRCRDFGRSAHQLAQDPACQGLMHTHSISPPPATHVFRHAGEGSDFGPIRFCRGTDQEVGVRKLVENGRQNWGSAYPSTSLYKKTTSFAESSVVPSPLSNCVFI
jgi:hypothetical protein